MTLNPIEQKIIDVIKEDIKQNNTEYSVITNNQISEKLGISVFSIRDKVIRLAKKKVITKRNDVWTTDMKYHNRIIYVN